MSDRLTLEIDCDRGTVTASNDLMDSRELGRALETSKASLIAQLLLPEIRRMMQTPKADLMREHLALLQKDAE
jgi:hypothetical protein